MRLTITGEYPADWKEIAVRVKAEAGNRCVRCGHPDGDWLQNLVAEYKFTDGVPYTREVFKHLGWPTHKKRFAECDDRCTHPKDDKLRQLTVHHLDGRKDNCRWWNLLALCQKCHLEIQGKVIPERPFLWEHSDWFKPYAAGFYAYWYGKMETSREVVMLDLDLWLEMGQPWLYERSEVGLEIEQALKEAVAISKVRKV